MPIKEHATEILVLQAGTNDPSNSAFLGEEFTTGMQHVPGIHVKTIRLNDVTLEHFSLKHYRPETDQGPDLALLKDAIEHANGVVITTPIWNFSVPAHLKNAIDRMGSFCLDPETRTKGLLGGKPFFLIFTGGASQFVWNSVMENSTSHMREAIKYFGGTVTGTCFEPKCVKMPGRTFDFVVSDRTDTIETMKTKGKAFAEIVKEFAATGKLPRSQRAKGWFYGIAGWVVKRMT